MFTAKIANNKQVQYFRRQKMYAFHFVGFIVSNVLLINQFEVLTFTNING